MSALRRQRVVFRTLAVVIAAGSFLYLTTRHHTQLGLSSPPAGFSVLQGLLGSDPCSKWDPAGAVADDPPDCLRAQQFREFQAYHASGERSKLDVTQQKALLEAERCVLGITQCPERPLIIIDYKYYYRASRQIHGGGEEVWGWGVIDGMRASGYILLFNDGTNERGWIESWKQTRALSKSIHMYVADSNAAVRCLLDPRCVRPEDYMPHPTNDEYRLPEVPGETGTLPAWRVFGANYWGSRPQTFCGHAQGPCRDWGQGCNDEDWSYHMLGNKWVFTPFAYPNDHQHIPLTMEQACHATPIIPNSERKDAVLVLAKVADYFHFHQNDGVTTAFGQITKGVEGIDFWTTVQPHNEPEKNPVPPELVQLGPQPPADYIHLLSSARAMLGIGKPEVSPTPYEAVCRGTPVLVPWIRYPEPTGWDTYSATFFQHGPIMAFGEPYVYSYNVSDPEDLIAKIKKAIDTPIEPYIPEEMTTASVHARVAEILAHDWEGEYNQIKAKNGGKIPPYQNVMIEKCFNTHNVAPCTGKYDMP